METPPPGPKELSKKDQKVLWSRARDRCSFPKCRAKLTRDQVDVETGEVFATPVGDEAHIHSASPSGPRFDPNYPTHKLETYDNRILLCKVCHKLIDDNGGAAYDAATVIAMKQAHERQEDRLERISRTVRSYLVDQFERDHEVHFRQAQLHGPRVDEMFVDVPVRSRASTTATAALARVAKPSREADARRGQTVAGAAQALLHPEWRGNALLVGGPGQGKSTLLQYVCQFHRARYLGKADYTGRAQDITLVAETARIPLRIDLRVYVNWARERQAAKAPQKRSSRNASSEDTHDSWASIEEYLAWQIGKFSGGVKFNVKDLIALVGAQPVLIALDGLDEVANLEQRDVTADNIVQTTARLHDAAQDMVVLVTTRPGSSSSRIWSSPHFPQFQLQPLTAGLRLQYLRRWCSVRELSDEAAKSFEETFLEHESLPHIRDLASYPMQLAIVLDLLQRRGLLPQQRTALYSDYVQAFLDREQAEKKEPLAASHRQLLVDVHANFGWHLQREAEENAGSGLLARDQVGRMLRTMLGDQPEGLELAESFFKAIDGRVLCLIERETGYFQFEVQSLREYFAALFIHEHTDTRGSGRWDCFDAMLGSPYWLNTCRFFVGMMTRMEVQGIETSLRALQQKRDLQLHPHLRLVAAKLLNDRAYQGSGPLAVQSVVNFILDGPGSTLAELGLLDEAGRSLVFSEGAGRTEAAAHLKARLTGRPHVDEATSIARLLREHDTHESLGAWWVEQSAEPRVWLEVAAEIGLLETGHARLDEALSTVLADPFSHDVWRAEIMARGSYLGASPRVLDPLARELADGAALVLEPTSNETPLGALLIAARSVLAKPYASPPARAFRSSHEPDGRRRRSSRSATVVAADQAAMSLHRLRSTDSSAEEWSDGVEECARFWGDSWLTRCMIGHLPTTLDLQGVGRILEGRGSPVAAWLAFEAQARACRSDSTWWAKAYSHTSDSLGRRSWVHALLRLASTSVVQSRVGDLDGALATMETRHLRAVYMDALRISQTPGSQRLLISDPLRLNRFKATPRALWLLRSVATEDSRRQIEKKVSSDYEDLLALGLPDIEVLLSVVSAHRKIPVEALRGTGGHLSHVLSSGQNLGQVNSKQASQILAEPWLWPPEIVERATQRESERLAKRPSIGRVAAQEGWFAASR